MEDKRVVLEIDGVEVECSQNRLAQCSDYFKAMFHGSFVENSQNMIHLKDISPSDMKSALSLIEQSERVNDLTLNQALGVLQISSMFQFRDLQHAVESHLSENLLNTESCLYIANAAEALLIPNLKARALLFAFWNFPQVHYTEAFLELQLEELKKYLCSDKLYTPNGETEVFDAVLRWLDHNNFTDTLEVLYCVRFHLCSSHDLTTILESKVPSDRRLLAEVITSILDSKAPNREEKSQEKPLENNGKLARHHHQKFSPEVNNFTKHLNGNPRRSPLIPCFAGYVTPKKEDSQRKPKMYAFCFDETRKEKLYPFMTIGHDAIGCAVVSRGDVIYTVGGELVLGQGRWNNILRSYDVWQRKWDELTNLPSPRRHHSVILIEDNIYLLCGCGKFRVVLETFEKYNTQLDEWTKLPPLPQNAYCVAACAHKGSIFVVHNQTLCYQYSIEGKQWTKLPANFPPAAGFTSALSYGDFIYLTGWRNRRKPDANDETSLPEQPHGPYSNDVYKFEPGCGSEALLVGEFTHGASNTCLVGCCIYSFTTVEGEIFVERYDITTNEFSIVWNSKTESLPFNVDFSPPLRAFSAVNCLEEICIVF